MVKLQEECIMIEYSCKDCGEFMFSTIILVKQKCPKCNKLMNADEIE